jgi:hypothetical protein
MSEADEQKGFLFENREAWLHAARTELTSLRDRFHVARPSKPHDRRMLGGHAIAVCWPMPAAPDDAGLTAV